MPSPSLIAVVSRLTPIKLTGGETGVPSSWMQVAVVGQYEHGDYGKFSITADDLRQMLDNFTSGTYPVPPTELCIDYDHLSLRPPAAGDGKAAGWVKQLQLRENDQELWARVEWTETGHRSVSSHEYRFVSPVFDKHFTSHTGDEIGCTFLGAAITNLPFLQGMAPIAARAGTKRPAVIALAEFSHGEICGRIQDALQEYLNCDEWACFVQDVYDAYAVYYYRDALYRIGYAIADNGAVTFDGQPQEVTVNYTVLTARQKGPAMNAITLKDAQGRDVQIDSATLEQTELVKTLRAQVPAKDTVVLSAAQVETMQSSITKLTGDVTALTATVASERAAREAAEKTLREADADAEVDKVLRAGKILPAQKDIYREIALNNRELFTKLTATLPVVSPLRPHPIGSGSDGAATAWDTIQTKAKALRQAKPSLTQQQAEAQVMKDEPELYAQHEAETSPFARGAR